MQYVDVKVHQNIATILLDRPDHRNALNPRMMEDLQTAFSDVHQEKRATAVILAGAGDDFCSGLDLHVMNEIASMPSGESTSGESTSGESTAQWFSLWNQFAELIDQMLRFPKPIIAAVDGSALGAGLSLALASDMIVASKRTSLGAVAVRRGLVGGATTALLAFRAGAATAARMSLTGEPVDAETAYRLGLCTDPVESAQIWVSAMDWAKRCSGAPREAVQATKRVLNESIGEALLSQVLAATATSATACTTESAVEGIQAFCKKQASPWSSDR